MQQETQIKIKIKYLYLKDSCFVFYYKLTLYLLLSAS